MIRFELRTAGVLAMTGALARASDALDDFEPLWWAIGDNWRDKADEMFDTSGASRGTRWQALSPGYGAWKAIVRPGQPILRFDDDLMTSMTVEGAPDNITRLEKGWAEFGTADPKAYKHQHGDPETHLPARPILTLSPKDERDWTELGDMWVAEVFRGVGLR